MPIRTFQGDAPRIDKTAFVDDTAVVIGRIVIGADSSVWPTCVLRGDLFEIRIGERTNIQDGSILHTTSKSEFSPGFGLEIGDDVTVGHGAMLHACTIGNACLIGMRATVLDGAVVEDGAMVGAGALVPPGKRVKGGRLWLGSPAKCARELTDKEKEFLLFSAQHYVEVKNEHVGSR